MPREISKPLFNATSDQERSSICQSWLMHTHIADELEVLPQSETHMQILYQFTDLNCDFAKRKNFSEKKMACFMEIMHYVMKQLVKERLSEDESFQNFKELLLRHAIQRPPHSLAIFNLQDVKDIDEFVLDTFYRHYDMYKYALTVKDLLHLESVPVMHKVEAQTFDNLTQAREVSMHSFEALQEYMSQQEKDAFERERDYMEKGPGKIEAILNEEMTRLLASMDEKIKTQDEEFMAKVNPGKK